MRPHRQQPTRLLCPWDSPGKNTGVDCHFLLQCMKVKSESEVAQSCPTLSNPMDCSLPGSSIHWICQARVLEWGAVAFSSTAAAVSKMTLLQEQIKKASGYETTDTANVFFSMLIKKRERENQKQFALVCSRKQYSFTDFPQDCLSSPIICHNIIQRDLTV